MKGFIVYFWNGSFWKKDNPNELQTLKKAKQIVLKRQERMPNVYIFILNKNSKIAHVQKKFDIGKEWKFKLAIVDVVIKMEKFKPVLEFYD